MPRHITGSLNSVRSGRFSAEGTTFIEILVTIFVLVLGLTALLTTLTHAMRGIQQNEAGLIASTAVSRLMEGERNKTFDELVSYSFTVPDLPNAQGQVTVQNYNGDPNLKHVIVTLTLDPARAWRLATLISR